ncbi:hypothetical protein Lal_00036521 [Lupinus albus]|nr:hypothetical protein Lal_00036521 [Lupinus albus]
MPKDDNLRKRGGLLASMCSNCHAHPEDSSHMFLSCSFALKLWDWLSIIFYFHIDTTSIEIIFLGCNGKWSPRVHGVLEAAIIHTVNTVWYCRNLWRFENKHISLLQAQLRIKLATSLSVNHSKLLTKNLVDNFVILREFKVKQNFQKAPRIREVIWLAPLVGWIKINSDSAAHGAPGLAGGGCIFKDYNGSFKSVFAYFHGITNSLFAELKAALMAIGIAYRKGWMDIWLECDSTLMLYIFKGKGRIPWKLANKWNTCLECISSMRFIVTHIYREGNTCADRLAAFGVSSKLYTWCTTTDFVFSGCFFAISRGF